MCLKIASFCLYKLSLILQPQIMWSHNGVSFIVYMPNERERAIVPFTLLLETILELRFWPYTIQSVFVYNFEQYFCQRVSLSNNKCCAHVSSFKFHRYACVNTCIDNKHFHQIFFRMIKMRLSWTHLKIFESFCGWRKNGQEITQTTQPHPHCNGSALLVYLVISILCKYANDMHFIMHFLTNKRLHLRK